MTLISIYSTNSHIITFYLIFVELEGPHQNASSEIQKDDLILTKVKLNFQSNHISNNSFHKTLLFAPPQYC
jgi:hypothetical protein